MADTRKTTISGRHLEEPLIPMVAFASPAFHRDAFPLAGFIGPEQEKTLRRLLNGAFAHRTLKQIDAVMGRIAQMPISYGTKGMADPTCWLHYSVGKAHIFITEKDAGAEGDDEEDFQSQAYGLSSLYGDGSYGIGYVSIPEILAAGAELDLEFTPLALSEVKNLLESL